MPTLRHDALNREGDLVQMCGALTGFEAARTIFDADPEGIDTSIGKIACAHTEARDGASFKMIRINALISDHHIGDGFFSWARQKRSGARIREMMEP